MSVVIFGIRGARLAAFTVGIGTIAFAAFTHSGGQMVSSCGNLRSGVIFFSFFLFFLLLCFFGSRRKK